MAGAVTRVPVSVADLAYRFAQDARDWLSRAGSATQAQDFYKQKEILSHAYVLLPCPAPFTAVATGNV